MSVMRGKAMSVVSVVIILSFVLWTLPSTQVPAMNHGSGDEMSLEGP